jgi:hypothetical protein
MSGWELGIDALCWPLDLETAIDREFLWNENGTDLSTTLASGTYYCHRGGTIITGTRDLYSDLASAMTAESTLGGEGYNWSIVAGTPESSSDQTGRGIRFQTASASDTWTLRMPSSESRLYHALGLRANEANMLGVNGARDTRYMPRGIWYSPLHGDPVDHRGDRRRLLAEATQYPERTDYYAVDRGTRQLRTLRYEYVQACHVWTGRADGALQASTGQVADGDDNNALERLWVEASKGRDILAFYYGEGVDPDLQGGASDTAYEVLRLEGLEPKESFRSLLRDRRMGGEFYDIEMSFVVTEGTYDR